LQTSRLQDSHTAHCSLAVHTVAAVPAKTAHKNRCAHARFILSQMPARGEAAFRSGRSWRIATETTSSECWNYRARVFGSAARAVVQNAFVFFFKERREATLRLRAKTGVALFGSIWSVWRGAVTTMSHEPTRHSAQSQATELANFDDD
jgi:hypothetical protein